MYYRQEEKDKPLAIFDSICPRCKSIDSTIVVRKKEKSGCLLFIFPFLWKESSYYAICSNCHTELNVCQEKMEKVLGNYGVGYGFLQSDMNIRRIQDTELDDKNLFY